MNINTKLEKEITLYCSTNNIDVDKYVNDLLKKAFTLDKYGDKPDFIKKKEEKKKETEKRKRKAPEKKKVKEETNKEEVKQEEAIVQSEEPKLENKVVETQNDGVKLVRRRKLS